MLSTVTSTVDRNALMEDCVLAGKCVHLVSTVSRGIRKVLGWRVGCWVGGAGEKPALSGWDCASESTSIKSLFCRVGVFPLPFAFILLLEFFLLPLLDTAPGFFLLLILVLTLADKAAELVAFFVVTLTEAPSMAVVACIASVVPFRLPPAVHLSGQLFVSDVVEPEPDAEPAIRVTLVDDIRVDLRFLPATTAVEALKLLFAPVALDFCLIDA